MEDLKELLGRNAAWAQRVVKDDPQFFKRLVSQQSPRYRAQVQQWLDGMWAEKDALIGSMAASAARAAR